MTTIDVAVGHEAVPSRTVLMPFAACRVFQPTKNAFVDTLRSVVADVKWFLLFLILTMWGFAGAFYILFREDQQQYEASSVTQTCMPTLSGLLVANVYKMGNQHKASMSPVRRHLASTLHTVTSHMRHRTAVDILLSHTKGLSTCSPAQQHAYATTHYSPSP